MPSRVTKISPEIENENNDIIKNSSSSDTVDHELKDLAKHEEGFLALPSDDIDQKLAELLPEDGYMVSKSDQVLKKSSKINTGFTKTNHKNGQDQSGTADNANSASIKNLRKQFGFSWQNFSRRFAIVALISAIVVIVATSTVAAFAIQKWNDTKPIDSLLDQRRENSVVYARDGKTKIFELYKDEKREYINIKEIPEQMQLAIIALEDENFYYNDDGIPWKNLVGAVSKCGLTFGAECRGASGLCQQLVKNVTGKTNSERNLDVKVDELFTALKLCSSEKTKEDILELYLNTVSFGGVTYGVQAASRNYFGKNVQEINSIEACFLAALVQKPSSFSSSINSPDSDNWKEFTFRKDTCLEKMHNVALKGDGKPKFITTEEELKKLQETPIVVAKNDQEAQDAKKSGAVVFVPNKVKDEFPHFREFVLQELRKFVPREQDLYTKGLKVVTTLDPDKQKNLERMLKESEKDNIINNGGNNGAAVLLDGPTGEIISMVGSLGYDRDDIDGKVNIITSSQQPGSSIKPYVYSAALEAGFNPATIVVDTPTEFQPGYKPKNFDNTTQGPISLRNSIQNSLNIPTLKFACLAANSGKLNCDEGIKKVFDFAERAGLRFSCYPPTDNFSKKDKAGNYIKQCDDPDLSKQAYRSRCGLSTAVGGCDVIPLSHATGINTLLQEGNLRTATPFISIKDNNDKEIYTPQAKQAVYPSEDKAIDPLVAKQITNVLSDYDARRPKFQGAAKYLEVPECGNGAKIGGAAAKTGTTNDVKDTWTVGGCVNYTLAVWVGRTDNKSMNLSGSSSTAAAPIWNKIMRYLEKDIKPKAFSTDGLIKVNVDPASGYIGGGATEVFTPAQKSVLEKAGAKIATPEYVAQNKNIYDYRSTVIPQKVEINKLDGKLATEQTLPENKEIKVCVQLVPEFPEAQSWAGPVNAIASNSDRYCTLPTEKSPQDQVGEQTKPPLIESSLDQSAKDVKKITFSATPQGTATKTISKLEILIDGAIANSADNTANTEYDVSKLNVGPHNIILRATDSMGAVAEKTYNGVSFSGSGNNDNGGGGNTPTSPQPLAASDISALTVTCQNVTAGTTSTTCNFSLPSNKTLPNNFKIKINGTINEASCNSSGNNVTCSNVPTPLLAGTYGIFGKIGNTLVDTGESMKVT